MRISSIANIFNGDSINEQEKAQKYYGLAVGYNYIGTKDVNFNHTINYNNGVKIPYDTSFKIAHKNTPLLCIEGGSAGRKIGILEEDVCFGNKLCAFETYSINSVYLFYFLQCSEFVQIFKHNTQGIIGGVSINTIKKLPFLLPPLEEQKRIVKRIDELFAWVDIIEQNQADIDALYDEFKKRTLTLAIQGKLVPQDPNDEPASVLIERIRAEKKAKLGKKYVDSYIYKGDDNCYYEHIAGKAQDELVEVPFDIPDNWAFTRLDTIIGLSSGTNLTSATMAKSEQIYPVFGGNGITGYYDKYNIGADHIIIGRVGFYCGSIHVTNKKSWITDNALIVSFDNSSISTSFFALLLESLELGKKSSATAQPLVTGKIIKPIIVALPPLAEQNRIVAKINEIFAML